MTQTRGLNKLSGEDMMMPDKSILKCRIKKLCRSFSKHYKSAIDGCKTVHVQQDEKVIINFKLRNQYTRSSMLKK